MGSSRILLTCLKQTFHGQFFSVWEGRFYLKGNQRSEVFAENPQEKSCKAEKPASSIHIQWKGEKPLPSNERRATNGNQ